MGAPGHTITAGEAEIALNQKILETGVTRAQVESEFGAHRVKETGRVTPRGPEWTFAARTKAEALKLAEMRRPQRRLIAERAGMSKAQVDKHRVTVRGKNGKLTKIHESNEAEFAKFGVISAASRHRPNLFYRDGKWWREVDGKVVEDTRGSLAERGRRVLDR